jgi:hypothetical protein
MNAVNGSSKDLKHLKGKLYTLYESHGFVEVGRSPWIEELAQRGWDYQRWGRPDAVTMRL